RLFTAALVAVAAALSVAACGSSSSGGASSGSGGKATLKLVAADYGTGPSNTSTKYWQGIVNAFHKANPSINVKITVIPWTNFDSQVQTMVQNHNYPDI